MKPAEIGVGIIGLGVVAGEVARQLTAQAEALSQAAGRPLVLRKIKVIAADMKRPLVKELGESLFTTDDDEFFNTPGLDIVVEAIGGERPAFDYQQRALSGGKYVVTSNKEVIAKRGSALSQMAVEHHAGLYYEASVGGGIPLISRFKYDLAANHISGIYAIINGTTNYILTRMAREGCDFATALKSAQEFGYAEANPENDIEGHDAVYKLAILGTLAYGTEIKPEDIYREGITRLSAQDFQYAGEFGYTIKLLAIGKDCGSHIEARVHPVLIPSDSLLAKIDGVYNGVLIEGDLVGKVLFYGEGAGARPTASAVLADVVAAAREIAAGNGAAVKLPPPRERHLQSMAEIETSYYLRLSILDSSGVLAQIARVLGEHNISILSVIQKATDEEDKIAEIVIMTHRARGDAMQHALDELAKLDVVRTVCNFIRVEE